ncbi:MAG: Demethylrebeccamycin-D-glucose O-methyltransferase [Candidatus Heimdallarchaeota archaeon LC_2]|nr:MAG: Demethylrebeccamycin-D-glucose O-methyltransferase [Candidatus Heimdallarchaeota archaeon LC_2]
MRSRVETYYDETYKSYMIGWSSDHFHMGIWDDGTNNHKESLVNTVEEIAKRLKISENDIVLDAGSGVGGSAIYLSSKYSCEVIGISNSVTLINAANEKLSNFPDLSNVSFHYMDFNHTSLSAATFTVIFGLESISHSDDKMQFTKEAFKLLKPGGRLLISDGFLSRNNLDRSEKRIYKEFIDGWAIPDLKTSGEFQKIFTKIGFTNVEYTEKTESVLKSVERMHRNARFSRYIYLVLNKLKLVPRNRYRSAKSAFLLKKCVSKKIVEYGFLYGEKPEN